MQTGEVCRDYVFSAVDTLQHRLPQEGAFRGCFGLVRLRDGAPDLLYIGKGRSVSWGELSVTADTDVYASLFRRDGKWSYSATGPCISASGRTLASCRLLRSARWGE